MLAQAHPPIQHVRGYRTLRPSGPLADAVESLWLYHDYRPAHALERVLPSGTAELAINLDDGELRVRSSEDGRVLQRFRGAVLSGAQRTPFAIDTRQQRMMMGAHFKPGGAWRLLGQPMDELADRHVALEVVLGVEAQRLVERLVEARDSDARLRILEQFLTARLAAPMHRAIAWAIEQFSRYPAHASVAVVAEEAELSGRRFNELFTRHVGVNPKTFARVQRFQTALASLFLGKRAGVRDLATAAGYADQAHFIREFQTFAGVTPGQYVAIREEHLAEVPASEWFQICPMPEATASGRGARPLRVA